MIISDPSVLLPEIPSIDISEARWAAEQLADLLAKLGPDSPVALVLRQARREIASLVQSAGASVFGPVRIAA